MKLHLCKARDCQELVIRDTEGFCSRHRAQKYHKKSQQNQMDEKRKGNEQQQQAESESTGMEQEYKHNEEESECQYTKLLNHLKATAPPPSDNTMHQTHNCNNMEVNHHNPITQKLPSTQCDAKIIKKENSINVQPNVHSACNVQTMNDDELVAQILTDLRAQYGNFQCAQPCQQPCTQTQHPIQTNFQCSPEQKESTECIQAQPQYGNAQTLGTGNTGNITATALPPPIKKRKVGQMSNCNNAINSQWDSQVAPSQPYLILPVPANSPLCCTQIPIQPMQSLQSMQTIRFVPIMNASSYNNNVNNNNPTMQNDKLSQLQAIIDMLKRPNNNNQTIQNSNHSNLPPTNGSFQFNQNAKK